MLFLSQLIFGTGVGPFVRIEPVTCPGASADLRFAYQVDWSVCAPGGPCSDHSERPDPNVDLVLRQQGCFWPEPVHFVREVCGAASHWRVQGVHARAPLRLEPLEGGRGSVFQEGSKAAPRCPGPPQGLAVLGPSAIQPSAHTRRQGLESFAIEEAGAGLVRLVSPSDIALDDSDGLYRSAPMPLAQAQDLLQQASYDASQQEEVIPVSVQVLGGQQTLRQVQSGGQSWCVASRELELALELPEETLLRLSGTDTRIVASSQCRALGG